MGKGMTEAAYAKPPPSRGKTSSTAGTQRKKMPHVCVFDIGSDECLICGTSRGLVVAMPTGMRAIPEPMWKTVVADIATKQPTSRREWAHKPHYAKLTFVCVGCIAMIIFLLTSVWTAAESDTDECETGSHECAANALCTNLDNTYTCDCDAGYTGDGWDCAEVDECATAFPGKANPVPIVVVIPGSDGGQRAGAPPPPPPPPPCIVWNDEERQDGWQHDCVNNPGSFDCECGAGWNGTWPECQDVNECLNSTTNPAGCGDPTYMTCVNNQGSWTCEDVLECETDYGGCVPMNFTACVEHVGRRATCLDVNECETNNGECAPGSYCVNKFYLPQLCKPCEAVPNADYVWCTAPSDSRAACTAGYYNRDNSRFGRSDACYPCLSQIGCDLDTAALCLLIAPTNRLACTTATPGFCIVGEDINSTSIIHQCVAVENAASVICSAPTKAELDNCYDNSRAQCAPGYYVTTCTPGYYAMTCFSGHVLRDQYGSDGSGMIVTLPSGYYVHQPSDTCTYCHNQTGCAVSYPDICLSYGNTSYMACDEPEVDSYLVMLGDVTGDSEVTGISSTGTTRPCTSQDNCVVDFPACLDTGPSAEFDDWRKLLACANAADGYFLSGDGASARVTICTPVEDADKMTCFEEDNSRALCSPGFFVTDNSGMICDGTDDGDAMNTCTGLWYDSAACAAVIVDGTEVTCTSVGDCTYTPPSPEVLEVCTGNHPLCGLADLGGNNPYGSCIGAHISCFYTAYAAEAATTAESCTATLMRCDRHYLWLATYAESACPLGCTYADRVPVPCASNAFYHADGCAVQGGNCQFATVTPGTMDTCALCTDSQAGCVADTPGVCLAPGSSALLACTEVQPGYWLDGSRGQDYWMNGITTSRAVDLRWVPGGGSGMPDLMLPAPMTQDWKSTGAAAVSTLCEVVPNSNSVTCTAATNSRAVCTPGFYLVTVKPALQYNTSDACLACEPVANSDSITCTEASNSRAVCITGYYVTDHSAAAYSDTCYQKACDINNGDCDDACANMPGGTRQCSCTQQWLSVDGLPAGYELGADGMSCIDIDECYDGMNGGCGMFPLVTLPAGMGSAFHYQCVNNIGANPTCGDTLPTCAYEEDRDCDGTCFAASDYLTLLGDGTCDDGSSPARGRGNFDCPAWYRDNNDCCAYYPMTQRYVCEVYRPFSHGDAMPRPSISGRCSGNTDPSEDATCSGYTRLIPTAAVTTVLVGDDESTCCEDPPIG